MATTRQWLNLPYGHNEDASGACVMSSELLKHCQCDRAETLYVLLPAFCIAFSQRVPIFGGVPSSSG
jgi:hypothetical protein